MNSKRSKRHTFTTQQNATFVVAILDQGTLCPSHRFQHLALHQPSTPPGVCVVWSFVCLSSLSRPVICLNGLISLLGAVKVLRRHCSRPRSRFSTWQFAHACRCCPRWSWSGYPLMPGGAFTRQSHVRALCIIIVHNNSGMRAHIVRRLASQLWDGAEADVEG